MTDPGPLTADVIVDTEFSPHQQAALAEALAGLGATARIRVLPVRRGSVDVQWLVLAALPLQAFLSGIGAKMADDAHQMLQNAIRRLFRPDEPAEPVLSPPIVLQDSSTGLRVVLDQDLPAEGYEQLLALDLSQFRIGPVHYDRAGHRWRSELDEATRSQR